MDKAKVQIGDYVSIGPRVCIFTAGHPVDAQVRRQCVEYAKPVTIGDNVWIGGNVVINPGVTIGNNTVIGAGAVVTKDIPESVVATGNPCRVLRKITEAERNYWLEELHNYRTDPDIENSQS